jgi:hypothetical protein
MEAACNVALDTVSQHVGAQLVEVRFALFSDEAYGVYRDAARERGLL